MPLDPGSPILYADRWIECTRSHLVIRGYYFPWGPPKRIPYAVIRGVARIALTARTGKWRIWGTTSPRYWAHLDPRRPRRGTGLVLDLGGFLRPWITPEDPGRVEAIIAERRGPAGPEPPATQA